MTKETGRTNDNEVLLKYWNSRQVKSKYIHHKYFHSKYSWKVQSPERWSYETL